MARSWPREPGDADLSSEGAIIHIAQSRFPNARLDAPRTEVVDTGAKGFAGEVG